MPELRIGCSGFNYRHWKGPFYPSHLPQRKWFEHYWTSFNTVELNVTFYRLPLAGTFDKWRDETPADFAFSLKGSRYISHVKKLIDVKEPLELFFKGALRLKGKLKVILWQFSPGFKIDIKKLKLFLELLQSYPIGNALEFRHGSWITDDVIDLCKEYNACLCMADWPEFIDDLPVTSDFVYIRRHGKGGSYDACYSKTELQIDAKRIKRYMENGKNVFIYFNNDYSGYAPKNAKELLAMVR